jgi:hypothetical protein
MMIGYRKTIIGSLIVMCSTIGLYFDKLDSKDFTELVLATLAIFAVANTKEHYRNIEQQKAEFQETKEEFQDTLKKDLLS